MASRSIPRPLAPTEPFLTRWQAMALQGVISVLLVGLLLPVGLIAGMLALRESPVRGAIEHGELFLVAANVAIAGSLLLVSSTTDHVLWRIIGALIAVLLVVMPAYLFWASVTIQVLLGQQYSSGFATVGGGIYAFFAILLALVFAWVSYQPPAGATDNR